MAKKEKKEVTEEVDNLVENEIQQEESKNNPTFEELLVEEKDKNLRLFAEFENFRKRTAREKIRATFNRK